MDSLIIELFNPRYLRQSFPFPLKLQSNSLQSKQQPHRKGNKLNSKYWVINLDSRLPIPALIQLKAFLKFMRLIRHCWLCAGIPKSATNLYILVRSSGYETLQFALKVMSDFTHRVLLQGLLLQQDWHNFVLIGYCRHIFLEINRKCLSLEKSLISFQ